MPTYWIEPKAPLLFRDGRPFGAAERAETLPFPLPSTVVGALRALYGDAKNLDFATQKDQVLKFRLAGPLLGRRDGDAIEALFPKPADAVYFGEGDAAEAVRLAPQDLAKDGEGTDLLAGLLPVFLRQPTAEKPGKGPAFWALDSLTGWLADDRPDSRPVKKIDGADALPVAIRTHVAINRHTFANQDGQLFQTSGLDFGPRRRPREPGRIAGWHGHEYGLLAHAEADGEDFTPPAAYRTVGGEGRPAWIEPCATDPWPCCPDALQAAFAAGAAGLRLVLATPALFAKGWLPGWLDDRLEGTPPHGSGLKLKLRGVALDRWGALSGWDMRPDKPHPSHQGGAARSTRRLVPAGAVYWFEILANTGAANIAERLWLASVCDAENDRRDGFGLALPGVWQAAPSNHHA